jgi:5-formyltetrahydrofolate cyclo-ligase
VISEAAQAKRRLRQTLGDRRRRVPPEVARAASQAVAHLVGSEPRVRSARWIGLYASHGDEFPSRPIFDRLASMPGSRCLPRIRGQMIEWVAVDRWEDLLPGRFGILEPTQGPSVSLGPGDVALLPGIAFDRDGWRLGRGAGYFDRAFPPDQPAPCLVGVGYAFQLVASVPHDSRDRQVDAIVSEEGWAWRTEVQ